MIDLNLRYYHEFFVLFLYFYITHFVVVVGYDDVRTQNTTELKIGSKESQINDDYMQLSIADKWDR